MTCIVGLKDVDGDVFVGGDSAAVADDTNFIVGNPKVFRRGPYAIGYTTSFRMGQLLQYEVKLPDLSGSRDLLRDMVKKFIPSLRGCFASHGYLSKRHEVEEGGTFIVGVHGHLFLVQDDFQVMETLDPYVACGAGQDFALGALSALYRLGQWKDGAAIARAALRTAAHHCTVVREPFHVEAAG